MLGTAAKAASGACAALEAGAAGSLWSRVRAAAASSGVSVSSSARRSAAHVFAVGRRPVTPLASSWVSAVRSVSALQGPQTRSMSDAGAMSSLSEDALLDDGELNELLGSVLRDASDDSVGVAHYADLLRARLTSKSLASARELLEQMRADGIFPYATLAAVAAELDAFDFAFEWLSGEVARVTQRGSVREQVAVDAAWQQLVSAAIGRLDAAKERPELLESKYLRELQLESTAVGEAVMRYRALVKDLVNMGKGAELKPVQKVLLQWYMPLLDEIAQEQRKIKRGTIGPDRRSYGSYVLLLPPEKLAVITLHEVLGAALASPDGVRFTRLAVSIGQAVRAEVNLLRMRKDKDQFKTLLTSISGNLSAVNVNKKASHALDEADWGTKIEAKVGSSLLFFLLKSARVQSDSVGGVQKPAFMHLYRYDKRGYKIGFIQAHPAVLNSIEAGHVVQEAVLLRLLPMLVPPKPWSTPNHGGYLSLNSSVMRTKGSKLQFSLLQGSNLRRVFEGLDFLGSTPWTVNKFIYRVVGDAWENGGGVADLPVRTDHLLPEAPDKDATPEQQRAWRASVRKITQQNRDLYSLRCDTMYKLQVARDFENEVFYFPHNIDFRGRAYPIPPHLHHVSNDMCRALLLFAERKPLGEDGFRWLRIHLANLAGKDKLPFDERLAFTDASLDRIRDSAERPLDGERWWLGADDPWQCLSACHELVAAIDSGDPLSYRCGLPVHQDGSCNGLQHYAALGRDEIGARQVDLLPSDRPGDVYTTVASLVIRKAEEDALRGDVLATRILPHITRKVVKQTVMTSVYGVTFVGARQQIQNRLEERPGLTDEEVRRGSYYLAKLTLSSLGELFTGAKNTMKWLNDVACVISAANHPVTWVTPLGLPVMQPYRRPGRSVVTTLVQSVVLADSSDRLPVSKARQKSAFPPNFVHSLDATHMLMTALACRDSGLTFASVHDSYWTHACDVPQMNQVLREQFVLLHGQPILEHLRDSFAKRFPDLQLPPLPPRGNLQLSMVLHSPFFFGAHPRRVDACVSHVGASVQIDEADDGETRTTRGPKRM